MVKNTHVICLTLVIMTISCKYGTSVAIYNDTGERIDSIVLENDFQKLIKKNLENKKEVDFFIDFNNSGHRGDGIIRLKSYEKDSVNDVFFGYFSNGIPPADDFEITIQKDTIIVGRK